MALSSGFLKHIIKEVPHDMLLPFFQGIENILASILTRAFDSGLQRLEQKRNAMPEKEVSAKRQVPFYPGREENTEQKSQKEKTILPKPLHEEPDQKITFNL